MASVDSNRQSASCKLVLYGPGLSGKTTCLKFLHRKFGPKSRGRIVVRETESKRALPFEFFPLSMPKLQGLDVRVQVYAVPGQSFYVRTRKAVLKGVDALLFVADSQVSRLEANVDSYLELQENLRARGTSLEEMPHVVCYNKRDLDEVVPVAALRKELNQFKVPEFETVATTGEKVLEAFRALLPRMASRLKSEI